MRRPPILVWPRMAKHLRRQRSKTRIQCQPQASTIPIYPGPQQKPIPARRSKLQALKPLDRARLGVPTRLLATRPGFTGAFPKLPAGRCAARPCQVQARQPRRLAVNAVNGAQELTEGNLPPGLEPNTSFLKAVPMEHPFRLKRRELMRAFTVACDNCVPLSSSDLVGF